MQLVGIVVGAAALVAAPVSLQYTPTKTGLYVDKAEGRVVHRRTRYRYQEAPHATYQWLFGYGAPAPYYGYSLYAVPYPYSPGPPTGFSAWYK